MHLSPVSSYDVLERALLLYKEKNLKQISFTYIDYWLILKSMSCSAEMVMEAWQRTKLRWRSKKSRIPMTADLGNGDSVLKDDSTDIDDAKPTTKRLARPIGMKVAKGDQKTAK
jgi:hypothetical protein